LHSFFVTKLYIHMSFRSVSLHHYYCLKIKTHLSVNSFMNLKSRNARAAEIKSAYYRILPFTHFECPSLKLTNKNHTRNLPYTTTKHCSLHNHFHHYSAYTQHYRSLSRMLLSGKLSGDVLSRPWILEHST
jgi:hypothetical protein